MGYYLKDILELRQELAEAYDAKRYIEAIDDGNRIIEIYKENDACNTEAYADDLNNLAILYDDVHITDKAAELYREAAKLKKELLGEDSESYMETLSNLGVLLSTMGENAEAEEVLTTVKTYMGNSYGTNSEEYVRSLYNYSNALADEERYEEAIASLTETLECAKRVKGLPAGEYVDIHVSIADACRRYGNYRRARDEYQRAFRMADNKDSYFNMMSFLNAAMVYAECELYGDAAELYEKALAVREKILDTNHLDFITVLNNLAAAYNKNKQSEKALEVHEKILKQVEALLGKDHVFYGDALTNIGVDYCMMEDYNKSIEYHNKALEIKKKAVGEKNIHYIWSLVSLAEIYEKMGKLDRAVEIQDNILELKRQTLGEVNNPVVDSLMSLGRLYIQIGDQEKAQGFLMQAFIMGREIITVAGLNVDGFSETMRLLAESYSKSGNADKTEEYCRHLTEYRKRCYRDNHPRYARSLYEGAKILMDLGMYEDAETYLEDAETIAETMVGTDTKFYRDCIYSYCEALYNGGKYTKAADRLKKAASVLKKSDDDNEHLIKVMFMQAKTQYILGYPKKADEIIFRAEGLASRSDKDFSGLLIKEKGEYGAAMEKCGGHREAADILNDVCEEISEKDKKTAYGMFLACAKALCGCEKYSDAVERASEAAKLAEKDEEKAETNIIYAKALIKTGKYAKAVEVLELLAGNITKDSYLYIKYASQVFCLSGEAYAYGGDSKRATECFDKGIAEAKARDNIPAGEYNEFLRTASDVAANDKDYSKAIEFICENALLVRREKGETTDFADLLVKAAGLYMLEERYTDAATMYEKSAKIYAAFYGKASNERMDAELDLCRAMMGEKKYKETAEKIEQMDTFGGRQNEFKEVLVSCYKAMGAVGKLFKLKLGGN